MLFVAEESASPQPITFLTFEEQRELLRIQLENRKIEHQMELDKRRIDEESERARIEVEN